MTTIHFVYDIFGNYQDNYYSENYESLINTLVAKKSFTASVNLGFTDGVVISNVFKGDFTKINCAVVVHDTQGTHIYKIMKKQFIRRDLWRITMVKDTVSANWSSIERSDVLVSRIGLDRKVFDPILFTPEQMVLSEVKSKQTLLTQFKNHLTENSRAYGYMLIWKRNSLVNGENAIKWTGTVGQGALEEDYQVMGIENFFTASIRNRYDSYISGQYYTGRHPQAEETSNSAWQTKIWVRKNDLGNKIVNVKRTTRQWQNCNVNFEGYYFDEFTANNIAAQGHRLLRIIAIPKLPENEEDTLSQYEGKIVKDTVSGKYYRIEMDYESTKTSYTLTQREKDLVFLNSYPYGLELEFDIVSNLRKHQFVEIYAPIQVEHTFLEYNNAIDQPFQLLFIPMIENIVDSTGNTMNKEFTEHMLFDLIATYGGENAKLMDVQVMPYNPIAGFETRVFTGVGTTDFTGGGAKELIIDEENKFIIPIYEVLYTRGQVSITMEKTIDDYKIEQQRKYHLTSPSGATVYDFSLAKNSGLDGFIIDMDIRPFASFYRVQPIYKELYGGNYNDTRGLIFQEDMSLTQISSAWETYKRQNVNYLNSFNTDMSYKQSVYAINTETNYGNYKYDAGKRMIEAGVEAAATTAEAAASDIWGVKGAAAGAAAGVAIVAGAAAMEGIEYSQLVYNIQQEGKMLSNEIMYARQQFQYNISNIQAIPENVGKVSGIYSSNNLIPYLQEFEPTEEEIDRLNNYLDLYGVNCGQMINLEVKEFNYLQGVILKYIDPITNEEYLEINNQLKKGVRKYVAKEE